MTHSDARKAWRWIQQIYEWYPEVKTANLSFMTVLFMIAADDLFGPSDEEPKECS